jgi:hypothetical protein
MTWMWICVYVFAMIEFQNHAKHHHVKNNNNSWDFSSEIPLPLQGKRFHFPILLPTLCAYGAIFGETFLHPVYLFTDEMRIIEKILLSLCPSAQFVLALGIMRLKHITILR